MWFLFVCWLMTFLSQFIISLIRKKIQSKISWHTNNAYAFVLVGCWYLCVFFSIKSTRNNNTNNVWERCGGGGRRGEEKEEVIYQIQFNLKLCRSIINFHNRCLIFSNFISNLALVENQPQLTSRRPIHLNEAKWNESRSYHNNNYDDR